jgi:glycosyltransferase involved in cell wall biosynthesis
MNILHVSAVKSWGGGENHIENLCRELISIDPNTVNTILCAKGGLFQEKLKNSEIPHIAIKLGFKMDPRFSMKLVKICKSNKIDLLHIHDSTALTLCIMGDHLYNLPPFIFSKKTSFPIRQRKQTLYKYNYEKIKRILCVSEATKDMTAEMVLKPQKLECIYHGTNVNTSTNIAPLELRTHLKLKDEIKIIGNIANHIWPKDLETFIMTANELVNVQQIKNIHFVQIGAYTNRTDPYLKKIQELHLEDHISFIDKIPNAASMIPQFDISLITSKSEGIPQFIYESFLKKVPVVSTNVGGISEIIEHGTNGFLAPSGNYEVLADQIIELLNNPELIEKFTTISYEIVNEKYTTGIMAQKTLIQYKTVLHGR